MKPPLLASIPLLLLVSLSSSAAAAWQPGGTRISPAPAANQSYGLVGSAADGSGGATFVWLHENYVPQLGQSFYDLAAKHIDRNADLLPGWPAGGAIIRSWDPMGLGIFSIEPHAVLTDGVGGAYLVTHEQGLIGDYVDLLSLYRLRRSGSISSLGSLFGSGLLSATSAAADADGASGVVLIAKERTYAPPLTPRPPEELFVQRVDSLGVLLWPANPDAPGPVLVPAGQDDPQQGLAALSDGAQGAFFAWVDHRDLTGGPGGTPDPDLFVQHVLASGAIAPGWPVQGVQVCGASGLQSHPRLAPDGAGGVFVAWEDERATPRAVYVSCLLSDGSPAPGGPVDGRAVGGAPGPETVLGLEADGAGGVYLLRSAEVAPYYGRTYVHRLASGGLPLPGWPLGGIVLDQLPTLEPAAAALPDAVHGAFVSYRQGAPGDAALGVFANRVTPGGAEAAGWTPAGTRLSPTPASYGPVTLTRSDDGAIAAWNDGRDAGAAVFAQRLVNDGTVAVQVSLVSASADPGLVRLEWQSGGGPGLDLVVERRTRETGWATLRPVAPDGAGRVVIEDRDIVGGSSYGYRLRWARGGAEGTAGETWVEVPGRYALAIGRPGPDPSSGPVSLAVTLAGAGRASLELIDVAGRRRLSRDLTALGPGRHVLALGEAAALEPGVYVVRLSEGGLATSRRLAIVR